ncbi:MAG: DNA mismatch repair endonuclease MutL [Pelolinea sp.]|nr:DNA mismatch repair endonuclease MutL [Pelolinea sp.]
MYIHELPKEITSKIAAGEVVERPASVVKELIENSIDAGASEINIRIEQAGRRLIEVEDDGIGIPADELKLAVKRYATSKISSIEDLDRISSLGFRGEALASIAAVSRFSLESRTKNQDSGMRLLVDGGAEQSIAPTGMKQGTRIRVENLFFNVPARQKFLKKDATERQLITELITRYALFYSEIRFQLTQEGRPIFSSFGNGNRREILSRLYDLESAQKFLDIVFQDTFVKTNGFTSPLNLTYSNRKQIFCFINGRLVSDPTLTAAIIRAYHGYLMVGRFPATILFIEISPEEIDINVHPTKDEIRFRDSGRVFSVIHTAVRRTLSAFLPLPDLPLPIWNTPGNSERVIDPGWEFVKTENHQEISPIPLGIVFPQQRENPIIGKVPILRLIGQLGRTYIAAEGPDGLYLIDQHAAHERILFERMQAQPQTGTISQFLLNPETLQIPSRLKEVFELQRPILEKIGFRFEDFGPDTIRITALPFVIQKMSPTEAILGALESDEHQDGLVEGKIDRRIILNICKKAAIKGGQILSSQEQEQLIRDLENCDSPRTCPHGRPTMIHISVDLLERQFGRLGSR